MPASDAASPAVTTVVSIVLGVFGGGSFVALLRIRADRNQVVVAAAQGAVIVQTGVIDALHEELGRLKRDLGELRDRRAEAERELEMLRSENRAMRRRLELLERTDDG